MVLLRAAGCRFLIFRTPDHRPEKRQADGYADTNHCYRLFNCGPHDKTDGCICEFVSLKEQAKSNGVDILR